MTTAAEFKAAGNAALQAKKFSEAIENYTKAINLDGTNHVYFSNRSAAYLSKGDGNNALEDANSCIALNPQFTKGYSRKGAALHALKRYNDSIAAYNEGLEKFPNDAGLKKGFEDVTREKDGPPAGMGMGGGPPGGGLFSPTMLAQMTMDPRFKQYLDDPAIMAKIKTIQQNPSLLPTIMSDPKMMEMLGLLMGQSPGGGEESSASSAPAPAPAPTKKEESVPTPMEEDWSTLSPEEQEKKETQKNARLKKEEGNSLYKAKKFQEALAAYDEAIAIDPTCMTFLLNKAAVYFTMKKYDDCIEECNKSLAVGKENMAPFEDRAKAYTRCAKAYQKKGDLANAIEMCKSSQLESYNKETQRLLKSMELEKKKKDKLDYQDDAKAQEAKQRGNDFFREKKFPDAIKEYEEAVKRAPNDAAIRNNLSAALTKIMDFNGAKVQVEKALELDPKYTKAWGRKGDVEMAFKEYHKAMESYKKGLQIDPTNAACKDGLQKVTMQINYGRSQMTDEQKKEQAAHAMADPDIQAILQDPVVQQTLRDFGENPAAAQQAMSNPGMREKIQKLIAAGVVETA
uniref:Hsp70-Hsp90 organising protein n=2 Tax=Pseudo-nitzschia australis TaxID=44445 RepID=A0A7S4EFH0_9STRA|mmetsp:Transcript_20851/g.43985  ORF Transcript_20851/g.43985 Transcript_20851/m.43985 type:complete len:570 (+) Transcript_20851:130-1839(+)|eukprot:CAMPEP_0168190062 /NCGR_PEP_ID=MMETSP0139_2-20121125/16704_1 /TAXON_ID=44445 /ORGANISM="Pseudo-nitzschia australis, Strain 10249 10 AB" /LENGTH=569 /DNA_ID=CAMNT_0008112989 /DNA_START=130 /DNA_END=1839 /DNA_ORIENTATION=-